MRRLPWARLGLLLTVLVLAAGSALTGPTPPSVPLVPAADTSQFYAGNIISDAMFFDGSAMSVQDVQSFLAIKGASCRAGSDGTPCLKDYTQTTTSRPADGLCNGYTAGGVEPASVIIVRVAQSCNISPRVLLVILQKEQGLVTTTGSTLNAVRYQKAMGFACPDTAACDTAYFGFQNQVYAAARQFQKYRSTPANYAYRAGRSSTVLYNPNGACGSSPVYIQNQATAGLYIYTPYQPNAAALNAGYGSGDSCSAYGNRNFWLYFTDWFGSTQYPSEAAALPIGTLEAATPVTGDQVQLVGWALDPDSTASISVHAYVDGQWQGAYTANVSRSDVAATFSGFGPAHGYDVTIPVRQGAHQVCVYAINVGAGAANPQLGCRNVDTTGLPVGNVESATLSGNQVALTGWALDPDTSASLSVHAYVNGAFGGAFTANQVRADVGAAYPGAGNAHGFSFSVPLQPGSNQVCVFAINQPSPGGNPNLGCRTLTLLVDPVGNNEAVTGGATTFTVVGWAVDPETSAPIDVHVYIDGQGAAALTANGSRPDVAALMPGAGPAHGFTATLGAAPGQHTICVYAINVLQGSQNPSLGCRPVDVGVAPTGRIDAATVSGYTARVVGWALDGDTTAPIDTHLYVDGRYVTALTAAQTRADVGAAFPSAGAGHGFDTTVTLASGRHTVCAYGINVLGSTGNPLLSCSVVDVDGGRTAPYGNLDSVATSNGVTVISGWSIDPDAPTTSVTTHFYVDGRFLGATDASTSRTDVAAAFPGAGPDHGYAGYFVLSSGPHTVCTYALNLGPGTTNPALGCTAITVP